MPDMEIQLVPTSDFAQELPISVLGRNPFKAEFFKNEEQERTDGHLHRDLLP